MIFSSVDSTIRTVAVVQYTLLRVLYYFQFYPRLYGDEALDNALNTFVKLLLSIPQTDLLVSIPFD